MRLHIWRGLARSGAHVVQVMVRRIRQAGKLSTSALSVSSTCLKTLGRGAIPYSRSLPLSAPSGGFLEDSKQQLTREEDEHNPTVSLSTVNSETVRRAENVMSREELAQHPWPHLVYWEGVDTAGHPVLCVRLGEAVVTTLLEDELTKLKPALLAQADLGLEQMFGVSPGAEGRMSVVVDCGGLGLRNRPPLDLTQQVLQALGLRYQGRLYHTYLVKVTPFMQPALHLVRTFLSDDVKSKVLPRSPPPSALPQPPPPPSCILLFLLPSPCPPPPTVAFLLPSPTLMRQL